MAVYGWDTIGALGKFTFAIYVGLALVLFVVYPVLVRTHGLSVKQYFSGVWPAVQLAFVSRSSIGTLPLTQRVTERNLGVPRAYASFAVPLGATTKMDGCAAIYPAISAIFVAQFFGIQLDFSQYVLIALVSVLGSAATAGTTGAVVMLTLTLSTLGLPLAGVGLLLAIDPILDMGRTARQRRGPGARPHHRVQAPGHPGRGALQRAPQRQPVRGRRPPTPPPRILPPPPGVLTRPTPDGNWPTRRPNAHAASRVHNEEVPGNLAVPGTSSFCGSVSSLPAVSGRRRRLPRSAPPW